MRILIDYDGSTAICTVIGLTSIASNPTINAYTSYNFNDLDTFYKAQVLSAFDCIKTTYQRELKHENKRNKN